jgi:ABC-type uncharacterized transport system substrate-binding protein
MRRRDFILLLGGAAIVWPRSVAAQNPVHRIGLLSSGAPLAENSPLDTALTRRLKEHGYELGRNLAFERRGAEGHPDHLPRLLEELLASKIDVLITLGYPPAVTAQRGTTIPVVVFGAGDPVGTGLVASLARPGGNLTGISDVSAEVTPERMELLKQIAPRLRKVAMLWNADDLGVTLRYRASETGAQALGISVQALGVREPNDFEQAFAAMKSDMPDGILMVSDALTLLNRKRVFEFAAAHRLPAVYEDDRYVRDGGLMSYGPDQSESFARVAALVDRVLKGAKPAELPFEQPTRFRFVLNLKTAKFARSGSAADAARARRRGDRVRRAPGSGLVVPEAAKRLSGIHEHLTSRNSCSWVPGSRLRRAPERQPHGAGVRSPSASMICVTISRGPGSIDTMTGCSSGPGSSSAPNWLSSRLAGMKCSCRVAMRRAISAASPLR